MPTMAQGRLIREWGQSYPGLPTPDFSFISRYWCCVMPWEPENYTPQGIGSNVEDAIRFLHYAADAMRQFSPVRCPDCGGQGIERDPFADGAHTWHCRYCDRYWTDGEVRQHRRAHGFTVTSLMAQIGFGGERWSYSGNATEIRHTAAQKLPEVMARYAEQEERPLPDDTVFLTVEIFAHYVEQDGPANRHIGFAGTFLVYSPTAG
jgi:ribosomal protein L37AE/L43A